MFALLLVGALIGQTLCAPKPNCGGASLCDHTSGRQITGQNAGGYSSYSKWGSSSSWSSGNVDSGYGTTNPARLETFDEGNVIGTTGRQGNWKDEKSYVTDDRKGKIDYKAGQEVTGNSFKKYAQSSYSYGTNANHDVNGAEIIPHTQFESQIQDVQREITAFIGQFTFSSSSVVTQSTLDNFKREAQRLTNQVTNLCDRADRNSEEYHRLQRIKQNLEQSVQIKQQQIMNFAFESSHSISGSISSTGGSQYVEPQPQPPRYYAPTTPNPQVVRSERIQTECNQLRNEIDAFYSKFVTADFSSYDREDTLATFRAQVNAEIEAIKQKVANLKIESVNFDYQHKFVEDLSRTFNQYSQNVVQNVDNCEQRIREKQRALIEAEQRRVQERLEQQKLEIKQKYEESLRIAQEEHERQQKEIQELQQQEAARIEQQKFEAEQRYKQEQERIRILQQQQQPAPLPQVEYHPQQTVSPTVDVSQNGAWSHKYDVHISGSQHHELSASGSGGSTSGQQVRYNQPIQIGPHIDMTEIQNKMNQEFNRIVNSVSGLSSYSMQLTESNQNTINAQFQQEFNNLRQKIDNLCQESSQYHNDRLLQASENLKKTLEQSAQYFRQEFAKLSSSGSLQDNSSWQASGRYTNVKQPHVSNVEYSHSKSTEFELSGNRGHGNQQVICVEQYAGQPCIEPVTVRRRRQAGGFYSQQHESNLDEYTPRRSSYQNRRTYMPETEDESQQHVDPQLELHGQPIRGENLRRHGETQSRYNRPYSSRYGQQETEDLSQQYVQGSQGEDLESYQKPRRERIQTAQDESQQYVQSGQNENLESYQKPRRERIQAAQDESQQYVQNGQNENFESYQKPRRQRVQVMPKFERLEDLDEPIISQQESSQRTQQIEAGNLQREPSSVSTGRTLLDQRLVVDEPQELVKPIVKPGSARGVHDYTLDKSGFYDNPKLQENSKLDENLQQSYERPTEGQVLETHGKSSQSEEIQKPRGQSVGDLTLENSGFDDYQRHNERYAVTERPAEQVTKFKDFDDSHKSEDLTLQQSGFFENPEQVQNSQVPENLVLSQEHNADLDQQQSDRQNSYARNERLDETVDRDSTQQTSSRQENFGPEFQSGRRSQSNLRPERINSYYDNNPKDSAPQTQNREYNQRNRHPVGQYIHNLPQQDRQSSPNIIDLGSNEPNGPSDNANNQSDQILPIENQESIATTYSPVRPAPKPAPRYTNSWQVSQNENIPQAHLEQSENHAGIESHYSNESPKPSEPRRGDLPGRSDPTTEEPIYIPPPSTPVPTVRPTTEAPTTERPRQNFVKPEMPTERTPCYVNRCQQNQQFDQLGQSYYYRQQNQHNIRFSQQTSFNNQQNVGTGSSYQNPFYQQNNRIQFNQQVSPVNYVPETGYTFRYRDQQTNHLRINHQGSMYPTATEHTALEQDDLLGLNGQESSQQQVQQPKFDNSSGQRAFSQHRSTFTINQQTSQTPDNGFPARVVPLDEAHSRNLWNEIESSTRPTFWDRVGQKLSNTYEKVSESARTVYG